VNSLTFSSDGEILGAINADVNKIHLLFLACSQRLPVAVVVTCLVPTACSGRWPQAALKASTASRSLASSLVTAVMLICFYAHHNRYARCADTGGQGQGG
jgi:hypothetical protein